MLKSVIYFVFFLLFFVNPAYNQTINIGLFPKSNFTRIKFANATGDYTLKADSIIIGVLDHFNPCEIYLNANQTMDLIFKGFKYEGVKNILVEGVQKDKYIELSGINPSMKAKAFEGNFKVYNNAKCLFIVNNISVEDYLEGVVESESGVGQGLEYYKVQSIISRTFALKNWNKHKKDGYNLCNQVHCQAYLHKRNGPIIIDSAVFITKGQVLVTPDSKLAFTFYSANCGGQTCDPVHVWKEKVKGLSSIKDTFCIHTKQAQWEEIIPTATWSNWLIDHYKLSSHDTLFFKSEFNWFNKDRSPYLYHSGSGIAMCDLRDHFKLKSAFFSVNIVGDEVHLHGRGYGHGVGLCQEGAMGMARYGYTFDEILNFYFPSYVLNSNHALSLSE